MSNNTIPSTKSSENFKLSTDYIIAVSVCAIVVILLCILVGIVFSKKSSIKDISSDIVVSKTDGFDDDDDIKSVDHSSGVSHKSHGKRKRIISTEPLTPGQKVIIDGAKITPNGNIPKYTTQMDRLTSEGQIKQDNIIPVCNGNSDSESSSISIDSGVISIDGVKSTKKSISKNISKKLNGNNNNSCYHQPTSIRSNPM